VLAGLRAGEASCWRGFVLARLRADDGRKGGTKTRREPGRGPLAWLAWRDPWRAAHLHRPILRAARPLLFSPERFRGRDARAWGSLNLRNQVLSLIGRDREGLATPGVCVSPIGGPILGLRPNIGLQPVSPPTILGLHHNPSGKQEQTRIIEPRPRRERSGCRVVRGAGWCGVPGGATCRRIRPASTPFWSVQRGHPRPEPERRVYGMSPRAPRGHPWLKASVPSGCGKDTLYDPHDARG